MICTARECTLMSDYVPQFAWEPHGNRFAVLSTNDVNYGQNVPGAVIKFNVDFFQPDPKKGDFTSIKHLEGKLANNITWSPKGRHIAFSTLASPTKCDIEFWDLDFVTDDNPNRREAEQGANIQLLGTGEHYGITDLAWDPSGRYIATHASAWRQSVSMRVYGMIRAHGGVVGTTLTPAGTRIQDLGLQRRRARR